jgi:hypothetical protein
VSRLWSGVSALKQKAFYFSVKDGSSVLRLEEKRKNFLGFIFPSIPCSTWLVDTVEAACLVEEDIAKSFRTPEDFTIPPTPPPKIKLPW